MDVLTPRIEALRASVGKNFESSVNRKSGKATIEGADRDHRRSLIEGLVTARRNDKPPRRSSVGEQQTRMVSLDDFESFKRTIEARVQALEEALEAKEDEVDSLHTKLAALTGGTETHVQAGKKSPPKNSTKPLSAVPSLNLGTPVSPSGKKLPKAPASPVISPHVSVATSSAQVWSWNSEDNLLFLGQLGVFKLWTAAMVCRAWRTTACGIVLHQKRDQLTAGADSAFQFHQSHPDSAEETTKMLPPLFQAGGPYHTLGLSGFIKIQELLQDQGLQLKHLYKFMRDITRRK